MSASAPLNPLTERQQNFCAYGGTFGILLTLTCLIQHFAVAISSWLTNSIIVLYIFILAAFLLLALQKTIAPVLLIIGTVVSLIIQYIWMRSAAFSLAVLILFLYHVILIVALFTEQIPGRLKHKRRAEREEEQRWAGRI